MSSERRLPSGDPESIPRWELIFEWGRALSMVVAVSGAIGLVSLPEVTDELYAPLFLVMWLGLVAYVATSVAIPELRSAVRDSYRWSVKARVRALKAVLVPPPPPSPRRAPRITTVILMAMHALFFMVHWSASWFGY